jgi:hypothetical protein
MPRQELHTSQIKIDQFDDLIGDIALKGRENIIVADKPLNNDYMDELAFNEEPVTIRLEPSTDKNAATSFPIWVNGKGAEVLINDKWVEFGYLPVATVLVVKRKYIEVLLRAKIDTVTTEVSDVQTDQADNKKNTVKRFTSAVHSFSILYDKNPLGPAWLAEIRRRNM